MSREKNRFLTYLKYRLLLWLPFNSGYQELFNASSVAAFVTDREGRIITSSKNAHLLNHEDILELNRTGELIPNSKREYRSFAIPEAYVIYERNLQAVYSLVIELEDLQERLTEQQIIKEKSAQASGRAAKLEAKEKLYKNVLQELSPNMIKIRELLEQIQKGAETDWEWKKILIYGTYMKRCGNLLLLRENSEQLTSKELELALSQSMQTLERIGVKCGMLISVEGLLPTDYLLECYRIFGCISEWKLESLISLHIMLIKYAGEMPRFRIEAAFSKEEDTEGLLAELKNRDNSYLDSSREGAVLTCVYCMEQ